jgi:hypothetical protein
MTDNDEMETRLRQALRSEAATVQAAGDGLQKIRVGIVTRTRRSWWRNPAVAIAAAAVIGLVAGGSYVGFRDNNTVGVLPAAHGSTTPTPSITPSPSTTPSSSPSPSESTTQIHSDAVYVYYLGDDLQGPRLFREIHNGVGNGSAPEAALRAMFSGHPDDPDYATPWDNTKLRSYSVAGDTATVDVSNFVAAGAAAEKVAVQEIVYTVTANSPAVTQVLLRVNGQPPQSGHSDWSGPIRRAPMADVQAAIWILAPTQSATVGSPVNIDGYGTAFEGTISWEVRKAGAVIKQGHTQGGANGVYAEFRTTVSLPAGNYELTAFESSAKDGSPTHIDTKNFTVR